MRLMPFRLRRTALRVGVTVTAAAVRPPEVLGDNGGGGLVSSGWEEKEGTVLGGIDAEATNPPRLLLLAPETIRYVCICVYVRVDV